jgi:hypothetical protein
MNPASRILALYDRALNFQPGNGAPFLRLWGNVLGISDNADHTHEDEVVAGLTALRAEIELLRTRLLERGCPPQLFESQLKRIKGIASSTLLSQDCKGVRTENKNDVRLALEWAAWVLPDEEDEVPAGELEGLTAELAALEDLISQLDVAPPTKEFLLRQLRLIRVALRFYGVNGIAPVEKALEQSLGALKRSGAVVEDIEVSSEETKGAWRRVAGAITRVADIADKVDKIKRGGEAIKNIGCAMHEAYDAVTKMLPPS